MCCKTHGVIELQKPAGQWCGNCKIGKGCNIYEERPGSCHDFVCAWLMGFGLSEHSPNITKIVVDLREMTGLGLMFWFWEASEGTLGTPFVRQQTRLNLQCGKAVMHIPALGRPRLYLPTGKSSEDFAFKFGEIDEKDVEVISFSEEMF